MKKEIFLFVFSLLSVDVAGARSFPVWLGVNTNRFFATAQQDCDFFHTVLYPDYARFYDPTKNKLVTPDYGWCSWKSPGSTGDWNYNVNVYRVNFSCPEDGLVDFPNANCAFNQQKGNPIEPLLCRSESSASVDAISPANGNNYQQEVDYNSGGIDSIVVSRSYNSMDGVWLHNFAARLYFTSDGVVVVDANGRESIFDNLAGGYLSKTNAGLLFSQGDGWVYTNDSGTSQEFSSDGVLQKIRNRDGGIYILDHSYVGTISTITITNKIGKTVQVSEDALHQPTKLLTEHVVVDFSYLSGHLIGLTRTADDDVTTRHYLYEDVRNNTWLTGVVDERGLKSNIWTYDAQGRATSSQRSDGAGLTQVTYNTDGSSTVTNELGKQVTYRYQQISGVKRITAIEGEPSPNCPASDSSYTYNDRGLVLTKTDAQGIVTAYTYNDRGLEISRTEANGTPLAKITTTEWDPVRFLRTQVVEPTRTTLYTYDDQGRPLGQQIIAN